MGWEFESPPCHCSPSHHGRRIRKVLSIVGVATDDVGDGLPSFYLEDVAHLLSKGCQRLAPAPIKRILDAKQGVAEPATSGPSR